MSNITDETELSNRRRMKARGIDYDSFVADVTALLAADLIRQLYTGNPAAFEAKVRAMVDAGAGDDGWSRPFVAGIIRLGLMELEVETPDRLWARIVTPGTP